MENKEPRFGEFSKIKLTKPFPEKPGFLDYFMYIPVSPAGIPFIEKSTSSELKAWINLIYSTIGTVTNTFEGAFKKREDLERDGWTVRKFKLVEVL